MAQPSAPLTGRAAELAALLKLSPHPEGGHYGEVFRSQDQVQTLDARPARRALSSIDFLLGAGQWSAWHRVLSDEAWHLLEGGPLRLWLAPPSLSGFEVVDLDRASARGAPRHVVPAGWWQAAEPLGEFAYVGATVGPGFEFADFSFGRDDAAFRAAAAAHPRAAELSRLF
jgi:predicted cupin superfamily sugar epimerase